MKKESQTILLNALLPQLRDRKFLLENSRSTCFDAKRRWCAMTDRLVKSTRSGVLKDRYRANKFEDSSDYHEWKARFDKHEAEFSAFWYAMVDAGIEIPDDWNERK